MHREKRGVSFKEILPSIRRISDLKRERGLLIPEQKTLTQKFTSQEVLVLATRNHQP